MNFNTTILRYDQGISLFSFVSQVGEKLIDLATFFRSTKLKMSVFVSSLVGLRRTKSSN